MMEAVEGCAIEAPHSCPQSAYSQTHVCLTQLQLLAAHILPPDHIPHIKLAGADTLQVGSRCRRVETTGKRCRRQAGMDKACKAQAAPRTARHSPALAAGPMRRHQRWISCFTHRLQIVSLDPTTGVSMRRIHGVPRTLALV